MEDMLATLCAHSDISMVKCTNTHAMRPEFKLCYYQDYKKVLLIVQMKKFIDL